MNVYGRKRAGNHVGRGKPVPEQGRWSRRDLLRTGLAAGGLVAVSGFTGGCSDLGLGDTLARIKEEGVVRLGHANERPFAYEVDDAGGDGELIGAMPALHREIFNRIAGDKITVQGVPALFRDLLEGLNSGRFDVIAAGMFIGAGRCAQAAFSAPVYCARSALLVRSGNPAGLSDYASVAAGGGTIAVLGGAAEQGYVTAAGVADERITVVRSPREGVEMVAEDEVDAFTLTSVSLRALVESLRAEESPADRPPGAGPTPSELAQMVEVLDSFEPVVDGKTQLGCGAAAFRKTDSSLVDAFNGELEALRREGRVLKLTEPYGFTDAEMPPPELTTEQLCRTGTAGTLLDPLPR